jgi:hypothetical protein
VTLFPDEGEAGIKAIRALNAEIIGEDRSPFGPQVIIQPRPDSLVALSRLTSVQGIETQAQRVPLNDSNSRPLGRLDPHDGHNQRLPWADGCWCAGECQ